MSASRKARRPPLGTDDAHCGHWHGGKSRRHGRHSEGPQGIGSLALLGTVASTLKTFQCRQVDVQRPGKQQERKHALHQDVREVDFS